MKFGTLPAARRALGAALLSCALLGAAPGAMAPARADLTGSTVALESPQGLIGVGHTHVFRFKVTNASTDLNWIADLHFTFPACCTVAAMAWDGSEASNGDWWAFDQAGAGTSAAHYTDGDGELWGEIPGTGEYGWFEVTVDADAACPLGPAQIDWQLVGDGYGDEPHTLDGSLPITFDITAVRGATWTRVKGLY
ncbi:MAG: hypothetical protein JW819_09200 [Candidatus Krumholzibacteriota bacterium]|nr:hypothetical protein [Candidatus Krumholzibacteriota bacterium]